MCLPTTHPNSNPSNREQREVWRRDHRQSPILYNIQLVLSWLVHKGKEWTVRTAHHRFFLVTGLAVLLEVIIAALGELGTSVEGTAWNDLECQVAPPPVTLWDRRSKLRELLNRSRQWLQKLQDQKRHQVDHGSSIEEDIVVREAVFDHELKEAEDELVSDIERDYSADEVEEIPEYPFRENRTEEKDSDKDAPKLEAALNLMQGFSDILHRENEPSAMEMLEGLSDLMDVPLDDGSECVAEDADSNKPELVSLPSLEEALTLVNGLEDVVNGEGSSESSAMDMLQKLSDMMDAATPIS